MFFFTELEDSCSIPSDCFDAVHNSTCVNEVCACINGSYATDDGLHCIEGKCRII